MSHDTLQRFAFCWNANDAKLIEFIESFHSCINNRTRTSNKNRIISNINEKGQLLLFFIAQRLHWIWCQFHPLINIWSLNFNASMTFNDIYLVSHSIWWLWKFFFSSSFLVIDKFGVFFNGIPFYRYSMSSSHTRSIYGIIDFKLNTVVMIASIQLYRFLHRIN